MRYYKILVVILFVSCGKKDSIPKETDPLFSLRDTTIGISFENTLVYDEAFNPYVYRNFYNGGGVAIGDVNNDGFEDVYFTGNMVDNKLFLNKGNWKFEDITEKAGVTCPGVWSTGATFADINGDGYLDLYVCKSGKPESKNRHNELFINNGPDASGQISFTESSKEYGLDVEGLSVHAAFFDYDRDGDLDAYVLNNSLRSIGGFDLIRDQRTIPDASGNGNKFFRNDGEVFTDITEEAGIYSSKIGFGLGITLGDFNNDDWTDIFISNDFFERDYLYINNKNGKFDERLESYFGSISMGSMGADLADLDNDHLSDLVVTEMLPTSEERKKTKTLFESWDKQQLAIKQGYFNQFPRNTLQRNLGDGSFFEVGRQANVAATEWSWGALLFDMDNDGLRDIFISNGIYKDLLDRDYITYDADEETVRNRIKNNQKNAITGLIDAMPSQPVPNVVFENLGAFDFENKTTDWGLDDPSFSNGSAYGDLDNDGDLDLVVNNVNMPAFIYENKTDTLTHRGITLKFIQPGKNTNAVGAKAKIKYGDHVAYGENFASRGFQSSVANGIHFGIGKTQKIDTLWATWPNGTTSFKTNLATNQVHIVQKPDSIPQSVAESIIIKSPITEPISPLFDFEHDENEYIDFNNERLLPQMFSNEGPALAMEDLNKDGIPDFFIGGAKNQSGALFISSSEGYLKNSAAFTSDIGSEDTDALFFDADNDGDLDLYVCHGGKAFSPYSTALNDSFYKNNNGDFVKIKSTPSISVPISSSVVKAVDYDQDGDLDLFVGERYKPNLYGQPGSGFLLENDGKGNFTPIENEALANIGMITDAHWADINKDGVKDLVILGEWMGIKIFINTAGKLTDQSENFGLGDTSGLWTALEISDVDDDGDEDLIAGNLGRNNFFEPDMRMYISDFDGNGFQEQLICKKKDGKYYPIVDKDELISQIPALKKKLLYYKDYAQADMQSIFSTEVLEKASVLNIKILESSVFYNEEGKFVRKRLPNEIQYAPVYEIVASDIDADGNLDLLFGGNQHSVKPQFGRYDASKGWAIFGPHLKDDVQSVKSLGIEGQIRGLNYVDYKYQKLVIVARNNDKTVFYKISKDQ